MSSHMTGLRGGWLCARAADGIKHSYSWKLGPYRMAQPGLESPLSNPLAWGCSAATEPLWVSSHHLGLIPSSAQTRIVPFPDWCEGDTRRHEGARKMPGMRRVPTSRASNSCKVAWHQSTGLYFPTNGFRMFLQGILSNPLSQ